jgi:hypothetical protein
MQKMMTLVVVVLALVVFTVPASARIRITRQQNGGQNSQFMIAQQGVINTLQAPIDVMGGNLCANHRGTGDAMEASWCHGVVTDGWGRQVGYNPNSVAGMRNRYRGGINWGGGYYRSNIFGGVVRNPLGIEEPSKCFERVVKSAKKQGTQLSATQAMAFCGGQEVAQKEPAESAPQETAPAQDVWVRNDTDKTLTCFLNGKNIGTLAPHRMFERSKYEEGDLQCQ